MFRNLVASLLLVSIGLFAGALPKEAVAGDLISVLGQERIIYGPGDPDDPCTVEFDGPLSLEDWNRLMEVGLSKWQRACLEATGRDPAGATDLPGDAQ